jgi:hypothetical protein
VIETPKAEEFSASTFNKAKLSSMSLSLGQALLAQRLHRPTQQIHRFISFYAIGIAVW